MHDGSDEGDKANRQHARYSVDWRVSLKCSDWNFVTKVAAQNASRGGVFILTQRPPNIGTYVELQVVLPDGVSLQLRGTVVHMVTPEQALETGRAPGIGVRLDEDHATDLLLLEEMAVHAAEAKDLPSHDVDFDEGGGSAQRELPPLDVTPLPAPPPQPTPVPVTPPAAATPAPPKRALGKIALQANVAKAVGIDFGTTFTSVTVAVNDRVLVIPDEMGRTLQPSIVSYPERGQPLVGWSARPRLAQDPRRTIASAKRLLGKTISDPFVQGYLHSASYKTLAGPSDSILIDIGGTPYAVTQVCATVIAHAREQAERYLKRQVREAVFSIPVSFTEVEKAALRRAAQLANLEVIGLVEEPVAGALCYGFGQEVNEIVAVYDFGGGTFDFTVLDVSNDRFRVLATEGDAWLGGDDFDIALAQAVADALWRTTKVELRKRVVEWQRLLIACEEAKRTLTSSDEAELFVEGIVESPRHLDLKQRVTRPLFERLCGELVERSLAVCKTALDRAGLEPADVTQLVVTGGVARIPFVRAGVSRYFDRPLTSVVNPEEAISMGAGIRAARLVGYPQIVRP